MQGFWRRPQVVTLLLVLFSLPNLIGLLSLLQGHGVWFNDLDAVLCGGWRVAHNVSAYDTAIACPGGNPAPYMYLPQFASLIAPTLRGPDIVSLRHILGPLSVIGVLGFYYAFILRPIDGASHLQRAPILALTNGASLVCGNIAIFCHGLVVGLALLAPRRTWLLVAAIILVAVIKPVFLTYLVILAYQQAPLSRRAFHIAIALVLAGMAALLVWFTGGTELGVWRAAISGVVVAAQPGFGFLTIMQLLGVEPSGLVILFSYAVFAAAVGLGGLVLAEVRDLSPQSRTLLAIGVAQILNPRLMTYDFVLLAPLVVAMTAVPEKTRQTLTAAMVTIGCATAAIQLGPYRGLLLLVPTLIIGLYLRAVWLAVRDLPAWWAARRSPPAAAA